MPDKPSKNEEEYFARRDAELLRQQRDAVQRAAGDAARRSHRMKCPKCGYDLITGEWHGVQVDQCTHCHGIWFDAGEAETLLAHPEPTMLARGFRTRPPACCGFPTAGPSPSRSNRTTTRRPSSRTREPPRGWVGFCATCSRWAPGRWRCSTACASGPWRRRATATSSPEWCAA